MSCQSTISDYVCSKPRRKPCLEPCRNNHGITLAHSLWILSRCLDPFCPIRGVFESAGNSLFHPSPFSLFLPARRDSILFSTLRQLEILSLVCASAARVISTDLHSLSCEGPAYDMPTVMTRILHLGMSLEEVIRCSTISPASAIGWDDRIGTLGVGREADVTVLALEDVTMELEDCNGQMRSIRQQIMPHAVWRSGDPGEITTPKNLPNVENIASANKLSGRLVIRDEPL